MPPGAGRESPRNFKPIQGGSRKCRSQCGGTVTGLLTPGKCMKGGGQRKRGVPGKTGRRPSLWLPLLLGLATLAGCASDRASVEKNLMAEVPTPEEEVAVARGYRVTCPDMVAVRVVNRPDLHWAAAVDVDGTFPVDALGRLRFEGHGVDEIAHLVAVRLGVPEKSVL